MAKLTDQVQNNLQIELPADVAQGVYANLAVVTHSHTEFVMDFVSVLPNLPKATVRSRVILAPEHAKRLLLAMIDNMNRYEQQHGEIQLQNPGFNNPIVGPVGEA